MSAFRCKADITNAACLLLWSLLGVKRTWVSAVHTSANDPKRTSARLSPLQASTLSRYDCRPRGCRMRRREFTVLLGGTAVWSLAAHAQQPGKLPTIGFLGANTPSVQSQWTAAFVQRLRELGWTEGRNIAIEYRWAETRFWRSPEIIAEFVRLKVDVIVTHATANILAAKHGTSAI